MKNSLELLADNISKLGKKSEIIGILSKAENTYTRYNADDPFLTKEKIIQSHQDCREYVLALNVCGKLSDIRQAPEG